jgi:chromosome segregation ATPase
MPSRSRSPLPPSSSSSSSDHQKDRRRRQHPPNSASWSSSNNHKEQPTEQRKERKTKSEKICELQSALKLQKEETRRLRAKLNGGSGSTAATSNRYKNDDNDKLKEAVRALKRVTVQQEKSLRTLRQTSKQRRAELRLKDEQIQHYQQQLQAYQTAHANMTQLQGNDSDDDMAKWKARVADLELQLAQQDTTNKDVSKQLEASTQETKSLKEQLEGLGQHKQKPPPGRHASNRSLTSTQSSKASSSVEDFSKLKRELAKKMEIIARLEFDLEAAQEEIVALQQKVTSATSAGFDNPFPVAVFPESDDEDFFSDGYDDDDDDVWG